ncbi:MAG TPA: M23 family metallopeptidase [Burkholderiaceae bacterium]|jgi:lipoprotein NlpD|nr:M23 family metallopeptidase [Burkholderiaceae bacterium]
MFFHLPAPLLHRTSRRISCPLALRLSWLPVALLAACTSSPMPAPPAGWNQDPWSRPDTPPPASTPVPLFKPEATQAPVPPGHYRVQPGDTLLAIARRHGRRHTELQTWNQLSDANVIQVGQVLRVTAPAGSSPPPVAPEQAAAGTRPDPSSTAMKPMPEETEPPEAKLPPPARLSPPPKAVPGYALQWPTAGKVARGYEEKGNKGLDIEGLSGDAVYAAHDGRVAFSGQLRGYGTIVLIKATEGRMTAYAHLGEATAKEGQQVRQGDRIGHFRRVAKGPASLHFELRQNGQPADPTRLLPPR